MESFESYTASPRDLERHLLSAIQGPEDMMLLERLGVTEKTFRDPTCRSAFVYIRESLTRTGKVPSDADLKSLGGVARIKEATDLEGVATLVRNHEMALNAREVITQRWSDLEEDAPRGLALLVQDLSSLQSGDLGHTAYSDSTAMGRLAEQDKRRRRLAEGGVVGIPTGLRAFDSVGAGWSPGEIVTVMGVTGIGKSWMLVYMGSVAYQAGYRVLFIEPELGRWETECRVDTVLGRMNGFEFSNKALLRGQVDRAKYEEWLRMFAQNDRWVTAVASDTPTGIFTSEAIVNLVNTYKPDVLMIDGFHRLGAHASLATWEQIKFCSNAMKSLSVRHDLVTIAATQVQREAMMSVKTLPELYHGAYGKALLEDSQRIIALAKSQAHKKQRLYGVLKMTHGEPIEGRRRLRWDVDVGDIHEMVKGES